MATQIIALAILVLTSIIGIWKFIARIKSERRRLADEAGKELEDAQKNKDKSGRLNAWGRIKRSGRM